MSQELHIKILEDFLHYFLPDGLHGEGAVGSETTA